MKNEHTKALIQGVERSLPSEHRFHCKKYTWSARLPETTIAIALLRSRWVPRFAIELGVEPHGFVNPFYTQIGLAFDRNDIPTYNLRIFGDRQLPKGMSVDAFDLEIPRDPAARADEVAAVIAALVPKLLHWSTVE